MTPQLIKDHLDQNPDDPPPGVVGQILMLKICSPGKGYALGDILSAKNDKTNGDDLVVRVDSLCFSDEQNN